LDLKYIYSVSSVRVDLKVLRFDHQKGFNINVIMVRRLCQNLT